MKKEFLSFKPTKKGNEVVVEKTIKETMNKQELQSNKAYLQRKKAQFINESKRIKAQYDDVAEEETRVDSLLELFSEDKPEVLG